MGWFIGNLPCIQVGESRSTLFNCSVLLMKVIHAYATKRVFHSRGGQAVDNFFGCVAIVVYFWHTRGERRSPKLFTIKMTRANTVRPYATSEQNPHRQLLIAKFIAVIV